MLNVKFKNLAGTVLLCGGLVVIITLLPFWVLGFVMGTALVLIGIILLALC